MNVFKQRCASRGAVEQSGVQGPGSRVWGDAPPSALGGFTRRRGATSCDATLRSSHRRFPSRRPHTKENYPETPIE